MNIQHLNIGEGIVQDLEGEVTVRLWEGGIAFAYGVGSFLGGGGKGGEVLSDDDLSDRM